MIALAPSTIANDALMSQLIAPPTHAQLIFRKISNVPDGYALPTPYAAAQPNTIEAYYAYGSLDCGGSFVPSSTVPMVHTMVDLTGIVTPSCSVFPDSERKEAAARNLIGAGVIPSPDAPHVPMSCPSKRAYDFKECDLDAVIAFFDPRLGGTVAIDYPGAGATSGTTSGATTSGSTSG